MRPIPLFVELCAGLASVSGVLQHGTHWKPPISRMGRKTGYAEAILRVMGLRPRQGAERYLWAEADSDVAALLAAYTQPDVMRQIADIIRSWIPCPYGPHEGWCSRCKGTGRWDARDLWETLRREKRRGLWEGFDPAEVAGVAYLWHNSYRRGQPESGFDDVAARPNPADVRASGTPDSIASRFTRAALPWPPVLIAQDARIEPGEVAGWLYLGGKAYDSAKFARSGAAAGGFWFGDAGGGGRERYPLEAIARDSRPLIWPPVHLTPDATIQPADVLRQMCPQSPRTDSINRDWLHPEPERETIRALIAQANLTHSSIVQQGASMLLANLSRPMLNLIGDVLALRAPSQIVRAVVRALAVVVADHPTERAGTVEGLADQRSHAALVALAATTDDQPPISVLVDAAHEWAHRIDRPDLSVIGDLILGKPLDGAPFSHGASMDTSVSYGGDPCKLPAGTVVFCDPPYQGTTGYKHDLPRADVIQIAERWQAAGARVYISEAEPLPIPGWHHVEIGGERKGQKRTFGDTQEWLTCSHPPAWTPPMQGRLF